MLGKRGEGFMEMGEGGGGFGVGRRQLRSHQFFSLVSVSFVSNRQCYTSLTVWTSVDMNNYA
jgi:hypothetical protein